MTKKIISNPVLKTWVALNEHLRDAGSADCQKLLKEEKAGRARKRFMLRIHSRLNAIRAAEERTDIMNEASK